MSGMRKGRPRLAVCKNGHARTPDNVDAHRRCRICYNARMKARWHRLHHTVPPAPPTTEQQRWNRILHDSGLGPWTGTRRWLVYGHEYFPTDVPFDYVCV